MLAILLIFGTDSPVNSDLQVTASPLDNFLLMRDCGLPDLVARASCAYALYMLHNSIAIDGFKLSNSQGSFAGTFATLDSRFCFLSPSFVMLSFLRGVLPACGRCR